MKTITTRRVKMMLYAFMAIALMFNYSCSPEDGRDGRDGLNGINGIDGAQGEQGVPGQDGNANIEVSEWFSIQFDFVDVPEEHGRMYIEIENTLEFVEDGGLVMMFLRQQEPSGNFAITPLPYITGPLNLYYIFGDMTDSTYGVEGFIFFADYPGGNITTLESGMFTLRYVLIPGASGRNAFDFTNMSYEELMDHFNMDY